MNKPFATYSDVKLFSLIPSEEKSIADTAFAEFYSRYSQRVFLYCRRVLDHSRDCEDCFQETWVKFHSRAKRSALDMENPVGYLFRVAHNCCIDQTRNRPNVTVSDEGLVLPSDRHHHADLFESADFVNSTLSTLDFTHREAFVLHELEEMTYEEMAAATGETISALKNRVWRARKQLRTLLAPLFSRNESQVLAKTKDNYFDDDPFTDIHT